MSLTPSDPHGPDAAHSTPPVCPRHPGRAAYVRCSVCGSPACLECQRSGAAGATLCPECAARAQDGGPGGAALAQTTTTAPVSAAQRPAPPRGGLAAPARAMPVTWTLLVLTVAAYAAQWATRGSRTGVTESLWYAGAYTSPLGFEPWRMLTYAFVHDTSGPTHLALNMVALWLIGRVLEPALGRWRFLALYLLSAVGGAVAALWLADPLQPVVGASGAVYGLFSALFLVTRFRGGQVGSIAVLIGLNLVMSVLLPDISWQVHVGGLVTGAAIGAVYTAAGGPPGHGAAVRGDRPGRRASVGVHAAGLVLLAAVLAALTLSGAERLGMAALTG